ncbi:WD40-repeat-containing domain protein [Dipodascopsis uninucleata]
MGTLRDTLSYSGSREQGNSMLNPAQRLAVDSGETSSESASSTSVRRNKTSQPSIGSVTSTQSRQAMIANAEAIGLIENDEWAAFLDAILQELYCPIAKYGIPCNDFSVLSCGCIASEQWARSRLRHLQLKVCPNCGTPTELKKPVLPLRNIYNIVMDKRKELGLPIPEEVGSDEEGADEVANLYILLLVDLANLVYCDLGSCLSGFVFVFSEIFRSEEVQTKHRLISKKSSSRFPSLSRLRINDNSNQDYQNSSSVGDGDSVRRVSFSTSGQSSIHDIISENQLSASDRKFSGNPGTSSSPKMNLVGIFSTVARQQLAAATSNDSLQGGLRLGRENSATEDSHKMQGSKFQSAIEPWSVNIRNDFLPIVLGPDDEKRERHFADNYPIYRKDVRYATQSNRGFSVIPRGKVFEATAISPDTRKFALVSERRWEVFNIPMSYKLGAHPTMVCCGKSTGEYGHSLETCTGKIHDDPIRGVSWSQSMAAMSNKYLAIAGTHGVLRVHDVEKGGEPVHTDISRYSIRCIAISPDNVLLACGVTIRDPVSGTELPVIMLHNLSHLLGRSQTAVPPIQIDMPYRDPLNTLSFSPDSKFLSCSTILESRFLVINVHDFSKPRLVIRSSRRLDTALESEGITCIRFFPGNRLLAIASVAHNAYPIVIDTKIAPTSVPMMGPMSPITPSSFPESTKFSRTYSGSSMTSIGSFPIFPNAQDDSNDEDYEGTPSSSFGAGSSGSYQHLNSNNNRMYGSSSNSGSTGAGMNAATNIGSSGGGGSSSSSGLLQPKMVTRFHEVGTAIHKIAVSPRANSVAFLDRSGTVFLTHFLQVEGEHRRVVAVVDVTNANKVSEAASIEFSPNGQKLIIVDRKGILYIEDFGVGAENGETLKKSRIIKWFM